MPFLYIAYKLTYNTVSRYSADVLSILLLDVLHTRDSQIDRLMVYIRDPSWRGIERNDNVTDDVIATLSVDGIIRLVDHQRRQREIDLNCTSSSSRRRGTAFDDNRSPVNGHRRIRHVFASSDFISRRHPWRGRREVDDVVVAAAEGNGKVAPPNSSATDETRQSGVLMLADCRDALSMTSLVEDYTDTDLRSHTEQVDRHHQVAHALHYASIVILGMLVVEVSDNLINV